MTRTCDKKHQPQGGNGSEKRLRHVVRHHQRRTVTETPLEDHRSLLGDARPAVLLLSVSDDDDWRDRETA